MNDWIVLFDRLGLPVIIVMAMSWALLRFAQFLAKEIIIPARDITIKRVVTFFDRLDATVDKIEGQADAVKQHLTEQTSVLTSMEEQKREQTDILKRLEKAWFTRGGDHFQHEESETGGG